LAKLDRVELQGRNYEFIRFDNVSLRPGKLLPARAARGSLEDQPPVERRMYGKQDWHDSLGSVCQFIAFSSKIEVDVRWDKLKAAGVDRNMQIVAKLQD